jgi:hypothetical protein
MAATSRRAWMGYASDYQLGERASQALPNKRRNGDFALRLAGRCGAAHAWVNP